MSLASAPTRMTAVAHGANRSSTTPAWAIKIDRNHTSRVTVLQSSWGRPSLLLVMPSTTERALEHLLCSKTQGSLELHARPLHLPRASRKLSLCLALLSPNFLTCPRKKETQLETTTPSQRIFPLLPSPNFCPPKPPMPTSQPSFLLS